MTETCALRISTHLWSETSTQLLCTTPMRHWLEYCDWWNPVLADPLELHNGIASPSTAPGSGVSWNEAAVAKYLV